MTWSDFMGTVHMQIIGGEEKHPVLEMNKFLL